MYTVDDFRARYARSSDVDLISLLATDPEHLMPEARLALAEEAARRSLRSGDAVTGVPIIDEPVDRRPIRAPERLYPKAPGDNRFGAWVIDGIIGMGPVITAALLGWVFKVGTPSHTTQVINMVATTAWGLYYRFTKDSGGQSIGKKMCNLMVIDVETGAPCSLGQSIGRALVLTVLNCVPVLGWFVEPLAATFSDDGRRVGDRAAGTQVISLDVYDSLRSRPRRA